MSKVKIKTQLQNEKTIEKQTFLGILSGLKLVYYDGKIKSSILLGDEVVVKRVSDAMELTIHFKNKNSFAHVKTKEGEFSFPIEVFSLQLKSNYFEVTYKIDEMIKFTLEYEVLK